MRSGAGARGKRSLTHDEEISPRRTIEERRRLAYTPQ